MKRTVEISSPRRGTAYALAFLASGWLLGCVWKAEAATMKFSRSSAEFQFANGSCEENGDYWSLFAAASAAQ
jgi:hypothetical protein